MIKHRQGTDGSSVLIYLIVGFLAFLAGATVVVAPLLLVLPALALVGTVLLALSVYASRKSMALSERESWPRHALIALWIIVISLPSVVAFDQTGFTKDQGLFNPQSIGRILIFLAVGLAGFLFWMKWSRSPMRKLTSLAIPGAGLVFFFYGWYLLSAPLVITGVPLALSAFRSLEWILATGLMVLLFAVQNATGQTSFLDRVRLIIPMLLFLLFSNLVAFPVMPRTIYAVSAITGAGRLGGLFTHPNLLALVCTLLAAYALAFLGGWRRIVLFGICVAVLVLTYSRGGFVAFALMVAFAMWYLVRGVGAKLILIGAGLVVSVALLQIPQVEDKAVEFLARGTKPQTLGTFSERTAVWEASKILIQRSPWLGSSFISGPKMLGDIMIEYRLSTNFAAPHAHNELLQAQISGGPLALVMSLLLQLRIALLLYRGRGLAARDRFFAWSLFGGCVLWGFLQPSLSYFLYLPGVLLIWLLFTLEGLRATPLVTAEPVKDRRNSSLPRAGVGITGLLLLCALTVDSTPASAAPAFANDSFVRVANGHLERDGKRLRVWGVNLQSGVFKNYAEIDALIDRISTLGFNAIRVWPTSGTFYRVEKGVPPTFSASMKGDGSDLDRFDYLIAAASRKGINIQMTMLHYFDLPMLRASQEPALAEVARGSADDAMLRRAHGFAPYISAGYRDRLKTHISRVLARKNPYTGRRYADEPAVSTWELANEGTFVHCAINPACLGKLPAVLLDHLNLAWQASPNNPRHSPMPNRLEAIAEPGFYSNYSKFVIEQFVSVSRELREHARTVGGDNSGVRVQPFIFNTDPGERSAISHYAYAAGDVFSASAYSSPLSRDHGHEGSAWQPFSGGGKPIPFLEYVKVKDKPFIVYEGSFFRPYPFRAEWGVVLAAIGIKQDWDGAFLYSYGHPGIVYEVQGSSPRYGQSALPVPVPGDRGERGHYAYGFHHGGDPVTMASWSLGGFLFLGAQERPPAGEVVWDIPIDGLHSPGSGYPPAFLSVDNLVATPREFAVSVRFVSSKAACSPCRQTAQGGGADSVVWDKAARRVTVVTSGGKAVAGVLDRDLGTFDKEMKISLTQKAFGAIGVVKGAGNDTRRLYMIGNVENTGLQIDASRIDHSGPSGATRGVVQRGGIPLVYSGPAAEINFSDVVSEVVERDFNLNMTRHANIPKNYTLSAASKILFVDVRLRN